MGEYFVSNLKRLLQYEASQPGRMGGVYDYTQKKVAFYSIHRTGGSLSEANVSRIYDTGCFWADEPGEKFKAEEIEQVEACFYAFRFCIEHIGEPITPEYAEEIQRRLYPGAPVYMTEDLKTLIIGNGNPDKLKDISDFHIGYVQHGGESRTASLISYTQCINANLTPFIIHPENQAFYERYMRVDAGKLCHLLHVEQNRYREETEPLVMDWEAEKSSLA